jgi:dipeptidyl aminopeptidase/acylaminoacyl peptidase
MSSNIAPYGSWRSPITSDLIVAGAVRLGQIETEGEIVYWSEGRPAEKGRNVIVKRLPNGSTEDVTPSPFNARTLVNEYGGGSFTVSEGEIFFSNFADQRLYRIAPNAELQVVTAESKFRYADGVVDRWRNRFVCVREDHSVAGREAVTTLVAVDLASGEQTVLAEGNDFYSSPRLSPDGNQLAWLVWDHPNMPWDGSELWLADVGADGSLSNKTSVAGGVSESVFQPEWSPDGDLYFVSDRSGWWNLYRHRLGKVEALCPMEAEFGMPQWVFGMSTYAFVSPTQIVGAYIQNGFSKLVLIETQTGAIRSIESPYTQIEDIRASAGKAVFFAASPTQGSAIVRFDPATLQFETLRRSSDLTIDPGYISVAQAVEYPTSSGLTAHGFFYPPQNRDYAAPVNERPPLLVMIHGGPTSAAFATLKLGIQFWTSRGIAVLDVNYGGSTGYGRAYRERLKSNWGVVDVDDCVNGARFLAEQGLPDWTVDGNRLAITGGSAGGYTVLCALAFRDVFKAGASHYGVSDLAALEVDTHKFESRYTHSLVAPYPEGAELYRQRSPIHHTDKLNAPVIFFQGLEDKIVPPNQSEMMVEALRRKNLPVAYVTFEGEQHGFRQAANIKRALDGELYFYSRIFGFELADEVEPVPIENLQ